MIIWNVSSKFEVSRTKSAINIVQTHNGVQKCIFKGPPIRVKEVTLGTFILVPGLSFTVRVVLIAHFSTENSVD